MAEVVPLPSSNHRLHATKSKSDEVCVIGYVRWNSCSDTVAFDLLKSKSVTVSRLNLHPGHPTKLVKAISERCFFICLAVRQAVIPTQIPQAEIWIKGVGIYFGVIAGFNRTASLFFTLLEWAQSDFLGSRFALLRVKSLFLSLGHKHPSTDFLRG